MISYFKFQFGLNFKNLYNFIFLVQFIKTNQLFFINIK